jgi:hypothetical protein
VGLTTQKESFKTLAKFHIKKKKLLVTNEIEEREGGNLIYILELEFYYFWFFQNVQRT